MLPCREQAQVCLIGFLEFDPRMQIALRRSKPSKLAEEPPTTAPALCATSTDLSAEDKAAQEREEEGAEMKAAGTDKNSDSNGAAGYTDRRGVPGGDLAIWQGSTQGGNVSNYLTIFPT